MAIFMLRDPNGHIRTREGRSAKGTLNAYLDELEAKKKPVCPGDYDLQRAERRGDGRLKGDGEWETFRVK